MNRKHWATAIFCIAAMYGCEDETGSTSTTTHHSSGCNPSLCASGECLPSGECKPVNIPDPGPQPCEGSDCPADITYLNKGDVCTPGDQTKICTSPLICHNNVCSDQDDETLGKSCESSDDCAGQDPFVTCMDNGHCGYYAQVGEKCRGILGGTIACTDNAVCKGSCALTLSEGDECDSTDQWRSCNADDNNFCIDGFCRKYSPNLERGAECNDNYRLCGENLECLGGKCTQIAAEEEACNVADNIICPATMKCINSKCTRTAGSCTTSKDCKTTDTFCCTTESCGAIGECIPYEGDITHDEMCRYQTKPGIFEAQIQCRWQPPADDQWPTSKKVEMMPLVGKFGNKQGLKTVVAFTSYAAENWNNDTSIGVIRFINPETCETLESIRMHTASRWYGFPAAGDLNGDGLLEYIGVTGDYKTIAYKWNAEKQKHEVYWTAEVNSRFTPIMFDVDGDGKPEVLAGKVILNGQTGKTLYDGGEYAYNATPAVGFLTDNPNHYASLVADARLYDLKVTVGDDGKKSMSWVEVASFNGAPAHAAYADFGSPKDDGTFDYKKLDGKPEFVFVGSDMVKLYSISPSATEGQYESKLLMSVGGFKGGGPVTIGDFDNDGLPEIGVASKGKFGVYDPLCEKYEANGCADKYVLWERWSQDNSSAVTGSSLFDFDGDGRPEAVYADECFTRVYDGKTGAVLFSARRTSYTSIEGPVIADIDDDGSAEILMGSDYDYPCHNDTSADKDDARVSNPRQDPMHEGIRCTENADCPTNRCKVDIGLCICGGDSNPNDDDDECNTQYINGKKVTQYVCDPPIHKNVGFYNNADGSGTRKMIKPRGTRPDGWKSGDYKVCRASRSAKDIGNADLMIYRDRLDRWVSSRNLWNAHAYSIINVNDDGSAPSYTTWMSNWLAKMTDKTIEGTSYPRPKYNNYRLNSQGQYGAGTVPDITGRFNPGSICGQTADGRHVISGKLCNRGTKKVALNLPATFYYVNDDGSRGDLICESITNKQVDVGECDNVGCEITEAELKALEGKKVMMITNLDKNGNALTVECNDQNNSDTTTIEKCESEIVIVN